jgi:hypothetical protein
MKRINLLKAGEAEAFGALAVRAKHNHGVLGVAAPPLTPAQSRALSDLARSLVQVVREASVEQSLVTIGGVSFELRENGAEEVLSIRTAMTH